MKLKIILSTAALVLGSTVVSLWLILMIGETFFFDRLFYQKSAFHGYLSSNAYSLASLASNHVTKKRIADIEYLFANNDQRILGSHIDEDIFVVAVIGDSMTYGQGVRENEVATKVLEQKLNRVRPTKVYNLGISGDDFIDNFTKYQVARQVINPDLVIFTIVDNDLTFNEISRYPNRDHYKAQLLEGCIQPELKFIWGDMPWTEQIVRHYIPSISSEYANQCIFINGIKQIDKTKTLFVSFDSTEVAPETITPETDVYQQLAYLMNYFRSTIIKEGGEFVNNLKYKFVVRPISAKEGHPSKYSHRKFAEMLFSETTKHETWQTKL